MNSDSKSNTDELLAASSKLPLTISSSPSTGIIACVYVAALLIRIGLAFGFGGHIPQITDAQDYDGLAARLLETGQYASASGELISLRPPLYPALVAAIYKLFGVHHYLAVSLLQGLISMLTMLATHRIGIRLGGNWVGLIAATIVGFYPSLLAFNCFILTECLFTFFFTLAVLASLRLQSEPTIRWALVLGLCLGMGALTRSILWVCTAPLVGYLLLFSAGILRFRLLCVMTAMAAFAVVIAPWAYRNTQLHRTFTVVDVMGGRNVMMGNYEHTPLERSWATVTDVQGDKAWHKVLLASVPSQKGFTQGQIDKLAMRYGIRYFFAHPGLSTKRCVVRFFNFWQLERTIVAGLKKGTWGPISKPLFVTSAGLIIGSYATVLLLALIGLFTRTVPWRIQGLLLLWMALPCAIHTIAFAHSRYHLPLVPILSIYAAITVSLSCFSPNNRVHVRRAMLPGIILFGLFVCGWARELIMVDLTQLQ